MQIGKIPHYEVYYNILTLFKIVTPLKIEKWYVLVLFLGSTIRSLFLNIGGGVSFALHI